MDWFIDRIIKRAKDQDDEFQRIMDLDPEFMSSYFVSLFVKNPMAYLDKARRTGFFKDLMDEPSFEHLRQKTVRNLPVTIEVFKTTAEDLKATSEQKKRDEESDYVLDDGEEGITPGEARAAHLRQLIKRADEKADEVQTFFSGFGFDPAANETQLPEKMLRDMLQVCQESPLLKGIIEMLGRMQAAYKEVVSHRIMRGDMVPHKYTLGGDYPLLLPAEIGIGRRLRKQFLAGLAEGSLVQDQLGAPERKKRGSVIVVCDETGSMKENDRIMWAKAIATTLALACEKEHRRFKYASFGMKLDPWQPNLLEMYRNFKNYGGTSIGQTIRDLTEIDRGFQDEADIFEQADIVLITDGDSAPIPDIVAKDFRLLQKSTGFRMLSVVIDGKPNIVAPVSDEVLVLPSNPTQDFEQTIKLFDWAVS